ncbi:MAG TPA: thiamine pyrophosphate-dependent enzyme [Gemmatimonadaceae bacterium]|jgi:pyruvate/2-oxoglutarate/acetoin dehydrogenase E1 component/TPP-dependent pyruvate/acetoin dehydrogenase alpha subunit
MASTSESSTGAVIGDLDRQDIVQDYRIAFRSRQVSILARGEVMLGRAMFGIFGDGKEVAQVALAHAFQPGDIRSGYYRDQTLMFALGLLNVEQFFAQVYANTENDADPASSGRGMNAHFGSRMLDANGNFRPIANEIHSSADSSPTGSQMPRLVGLAYASKLYRNLPELHDFAEFSNDGNEIAFGTIGNASCAEGVFWESLNAAGVLQIPMVVSIWDDGYGISVPNELQVTKNDIGALIEGFRRSTDKKDGYELATAPGWDYPGLYETYQRVTELVRREHVPAVVHVNEVTQPLGHSTSGSHERYKSKERLQWEKDYDGLVRMRRWMVREGISTDAELDALETEEVAHVRAARDAAWNSYENPIREEATVVGGLLNDLAGKMPLDDRATVERLRDDLAKRRDPLRRDVTIAARRATISARGKADAAAQPLLQWLKDQIPANNVRYHTHLVAEGDDAAVNIAAVPPEYNESSVEVDGYKVLNACFDAMLKRDPRVLAFGEDVGKLGDVNQGFVDLQARYGELRVGDAGIREATIVGQGIGLAMRGLRPIAEIQYLDYLLYALQVMSDDLATLRYRSAGGQKAPVIVRTRGHRLVGIWHSGSPMGMILHSLRGMHVVVPRDMTRAAGFYNTLLQSSDPALVIEVLNGYRIKEKLPANIDRMTIPLGVPEVLRTGKDITIVTYGACCPIALDAAKLLNDTDGIDAEVIDVQSLLPFDVHDSILESVKKTNRVLFLDEDVPGGASAFMMQEVVERQGAFYWLDAAPRTLTATSHRPAYGRDGDYWSKPSVEDVYDVVRDLMGE